MEGAPGISEFLTRYKKSILEYGKLPTVESKQLTNCESQGLLIYTTGDIMCHHRDYCIYEGENGVWNCRHEFTGKVGEIDLDIQSK